MAKASENQLLDILQPLITGLQASINVEFAVAAMAQLQAGRLSFPSYRKFFETIKVLREQVGFTSVPWEDFDKYLWLYGQKKVLHINSASLDQAKLMKMSLAV